MKTIDLDALTAEDLQQILQYAQSKALVPVKKDEKPVHQKYNPLRPYKKGMQPTIKKASAAEPFHSAEDYQAVVNYFLDKEDYRDALMVVMGCTVGLRISDLLNLVICQVVDNNGNVRDSIKVIEEQKTGKKNREIPLTNETKAMIHLYLKNRNYQLDEYLFYSRIKNQNGEHQLNKKSAHRLLQEAAKAVGLSYHIGTHTLRKTVGTFGYEIDPGSIDTIQYLYNHDTSAMTFRYIGVMKQRREELVNKISAVLNNGLINTQTEE